MDNTKLTIGEYDFDLLSCLWKNEKGASGFTIAKRAKRMMADTSARLGFYVMRHQGDIPEESQKIAFAFFGWQFPGLNDSFAIIYWDGNEWKKIWLSLYDKYTGIIRVLRDSRIREPASFWDIFDNPLISQIINWFESLKRSMSYFKSFLGIFKNGDKK